MYWPGAKCRAGMGDAAATDQHGKIPGVGKCKPTKRRRGRLETTTNVWDLYDIIAPLVSRTVVAHAGGVRQIAEARVKTDKEDVKRLIRLLIADIVPEVWVPPVEVRELRGMISYRNRLVKTSTMIRNRLQSLLHRHNLILPKGD